MTISHLIGQMTRISPDGPVIKAIVVFCICFMSCKKKLKNNKQFYSKRLYENHFKPCSVVKYISRDEEILKCHFI